MEINVNGQAFMGFTKANVGRHFLDLCGQFSFESSPVVLDPSLGYPLKVQQECQIIVEGTPVLTGFIEQIDVSQSANGTVVTASGRDRTCDFIDSSIDANFIPQFKSSVTLASVCRAALDSLGLTSIDVIDLVNPPLLTATTYRIPFIGQMAFDFIQKYSKFTQTLLTTDGFGNLVITRAVNGQDNPVLLPTKLLNQIDGINNNIVSSHYTLSTTMQYNSYTDYSQLAVSTLQTTNSEGASPLYADAVKQTATVTNDIIRSTRRYVFVDDVPMDSQTAQQRAIWEMNYRRAAGEMYFCVMEGHTYDGVNVWTPNILVEIWDDYAGLNGKIMLIDAVEFKESVEDGKTTNLRLVDSLSYSLQVIKNYREEAAEVGRNYYFEGSPTL
jgi:prophage tail gpP-like protein